MGRITVNYDKPCTTCGGPVIWERSYVHKPAYVFNYDLHCTICQRGIFRSVPGDGLGNEGQRIIIQDMYNQMCNVDDVNINPENPDYGVW